MKNWSFDEHWECRACKSLSSPSLNVCWNCKVIRDTSPNPEASAYDQEARVRSLAVTQFLLQVVVVVALSLVVVKPVYCFVAYSNACPYEVPELRLVSLIAAIAMAPFTMVAVDVALIMFFAPSRVSRKVAEEFMHRKRPQFLRRWYSKLLRISYSRT